MGRGLYAEPAPCHSNSAVHKSCYFNDLPVTKAGESQQLAHSGGDLLGLDLVGEVGDEPPVAVEQVDDRGMVHQVGPAILAGHLLEVDAIGAGGGGGLGRGGGGGG